MIHKDLLDETLAANPNLPIDRRHSAGRPMSGIHQRRVQAKPCIKWISPVKRLEFFQGVSCAVAELGAIASAHPDRSHDSFEVFQIMGHAAIIRDTPAARGEWIYNFPYEFL